MKKRIRDSAHRLGNLKGFKPNPHKLHITNLESQNHSLPGLQKAATSNSQFQRFQFLQVRHAQKKQHSTFRDSTNMQTQVQNFRVKKNSVIFGNPLDHYLSHQIPFISHPSIRGTCSWGKSSASRRSFRQNGWALRGTPVVNG